MEQSILIVRPGALGDTILTFPLLASIRKQYPHARITLVGNRSCRSLAPPGIDVEGIDDQKWLWLFSSSPPDPSSSATVYSRAYVILNRPDMVVANLVRTGTESVRHASSRPGRGKHVVEHLHEAFGLPVPPRKPALLHLVPPRAQDLIWVHPGSGGRRKCVPLDFITSFSERLSSRTGWPLAVTAGEEDAFLKVQPAWKRLTGERGAILFENRPIEEICRELGGAQLFVGNDSGISHLAAGLGIPSTLFFISTDPVQWAPWVPGAQLSVFDVRCA
ncbi:MAG: glycosyltransferase family 9 protein [Deltaproteobacteria bacterium]